MRRKKDDPEPRKFAKVAEVSAGDKIQVDGGFTCIPANAFRTVSANKDGELFIRCEDGRHYLCGQHAGKGAHKHFAGIYLAD